MGFGKTLAAAAAFATLATAARNNVAMYWGQGPGQERLSYFCQNTDADIIPIGFMNFFPAEANGWGGTNFGNQCWGYDTVYNAPGYHGVDNDSNNKLLAHCANLAQDIQFCQSMGKKILLSLGGGHNTYSLTGKKDGEDFAEFLWKSFGPVDQAWIAAGGVRPWDPLPGTLGGATIVDGFDFDIEFASSDNAVGYISLIKKLRDYFPTGSKYLITGAPQCVVNDVAMDEMINKAKFDIIWVQFYNTNGCSLRDWTTANPNYIQNGVENTNSGFSFDKWYNRLQEGASKDAKLMIGTLGSTTAGGAKFYLDPNEVAAVIKAYYCKPNFGGVMIWEATYANNNVINGVPFQTYIKAYLADRPNCPGDPTSTSSTVTSTTTSASSTSTSSTVTSTTTSASSTSTSSSTSSTEVSTTSSSSSSSSSSTLAPTTTEASSTSSETSTTSSDISSTTEVSSTSTTAVLTTSTSSSETSSSTEASSTSTSEIPTTTSSTETSSSTEASSTSSETSTTSSDLSSTTQTSATSTTAIETTSTSSSDISSSTDASSTSTSEIPTTTSSSVISSSTEASSTTSIQSTSSVEPTTSSEASSSTSSSLTTTSSIEATSTATSVDITSSTAESSSSVSTSSSVSESTTYAISSTESSISVTAPLTTGSSATPTLSVTAPYGNSSIPLPTVYPTLTSTFITTSVYTVTSCAPTVTSCTKGAVTTATITSYTTYCPGPVTTSAPISTSTAAPVTDYTTSTVFTTIVYTVTACPSTVPTCLQGEKTTYVTTQTKFLYTTVCPVVPSPTSTIPAAPIVVVTSVPVVPTPVAPVPGNPSSKPESYTTLSSTKTSIIFVTVPASKSYTTTAPVVLETHYVVPTPKAAETPKAETPVKPSGTGAITPIGTGAITKPSGPVFTGSASRVGSSVLAVAVAGLVALMM